MSRLLFLCFYITIPLCSFSQVSDILSVRRKNSRIIKSFFAGSIITFQTKTGTYIKGSIKEIKNDSVFVTTYDIRVLPTNLGVTMVDTIARYVVGVHYKDIFKISVFTYHRFIRGKVDRLLMYGGAGYFGLNIINGGYFDQRITDRDKRTLGISAGAFALGYLIKKYFYVNRYSRKKHKIVYVRIR